MLSSALAGSWKLTETVADIGDGSGTWKPVSDYHSHTLRLSPGGTVEGTAFPLARRYVVTGAQSLQLIFSDGTYINYTYDLSDSALTISGGGCIEACGARFQRLGSSN